jgi:hypothetical protein
LWGPIVVRAGKPDYTDWRALCPKSADITSILFLSVLEAMLASGIIWL